MKPQFDTTPLKNRLSIRQAFAELKSYKVVWKIGFFTLAIITAVALLVLIVLVAQGVKEIGGYLFVLMLLGGGAYGLYDLYRELNEKAHAHAFARVNKFGFIQDVYPNYAGQPFQDHVYVPYAVHSRSVELGYMRPIYNGRRSNKSFTQTYLRLTLPYALPHMVVDRRRQHVAAWNVENAVSIKLEGEFGNLYNLKVTKGYERDALYIFTPDVMERFIDATPDFDCEIIGSELYFYTNQKISIINPGNIDKLDLAIAHVMEKFSSQSSKYSRSASS